MRWTKKKRDEFRDEIDLLLAMADMAERPASVTDLREVFGKKYAAYDKHVFVRQFCEAEIVVDGPSMINEVGSDYGDAKFLSGCDPKTDLPKKFNVSLCQVTNGLANFHQLRSIPISALRGQKILSPWFAKYSIFSMDLETGIGAGSEDVVFWAVNRWQRKDTQKESFTRFKGAAPGEVIYVVADTDPEVTNRTCSMLSGLVFCRDFHWRVVIKTPEGNSFSITTDSKGAAAAFADRSGDTPSGRRSALRNWVSEHTRQTRKATDEGDDLLQTVFVRKHLRGRVPFRWCGLDCELVVSPFDMKQNERLAESRKLIST